MTSLTVQAAGGGILAEYKDDEYDDHIVHQSGALIVYWHDNKGEHTDGWSFGTWAAWQERGRVALAP